MGLLRGGAMCARRPAETTIYRPAGAPLLGISGRDTSVRREEGGTQVCVAILRAEVPHLALRGRSAAVLIPGDGYGVVVPRLSSGLVSHIGSTPGSEDCCLNAIVT